MPGNLRMRGARSAKKYIARKTSQTYIWRPCVPSWEKEFTWKVGNFRWEDFVEARKMIFMNKKIMDWEDSACEEAFIAAKKRFWDHYNGYESEVLLPDPDMHIDKNIDCNLEPRENKQDEDPMLSISDAEDDLSRLGKVKPIPPPIRFEDIVPTGWDVDVPETTDLLTGLVVGDDDPENDNVLQDSINIGRELPASGKFQIR
nr:PREDICTED: uncharacterized protein LOC108221310 [Daucus carota subsp. sativus]